jgi:hypothetical protein
MITEGEDKKHFFIVGYKSAGLSLITTQFQGD